MVINSEFKPAWWLSNRHAQTIYPTLFRRVRQLSPQRERIEFPDGDFADCDWVGGIDAATRPVVIVLHGLEGSIRSSYAAGLIAAIQRRGWRGGLLHFRGCSGEPNRLASSYHSGFIDDLDFLVRRLRHEEPYTPIAIVGFSLGGSVLLNWLGDHNSATSTINAAVGVSVPFDLALAAETVANKTSWIYNNYLLRSMRANTARKFASIPSPIRMPHLRSLKTFRQFDNAITAPLNGFANADEYYRRCSSRQFVAQVDTIPTLLIHSDDDPVTGSGAIPTANELGSSVALELTRGGGHVGFVSGCNPMRPTYWLDTRIPAFLDTYLTP